MDQKLKEKLILSLLDIDKNEVKDNNSNELSSFGIGEICMIRTYSAGVHFGKLKERKGRDCILEDSQRIYYWEGACSLSQLSKEGSKKIENCKISVAINKILLTEVIEVIPMTKMAIDNLKSVIIWKK